MQNCYLNNLQNLYIRFSTTFTIYYIYLRSISSYSYTYRLIQFYFYIFSFLTKNLFSIYI